MRPLITLLAGLLLAAASARAAFVNIAVDAGQLYNASGSPLSAGSLVLLIADTGKNGFGGFLSGSSLAEGGYLNGDDQILYRGEIMIDGGLSVTDFGARDLPLGEGLFPDLQTGEALSIVWFPDLTSASFSALSGASYGQFTTLTPLDGSNAWVVPAPGSNVDLKFFTLASKLGSYPELTAYASLSVIPEPREYALAVGGLLGGLILLRHRARMSRKFSC